MSNSSHLKKILSALWLTASIFIGSSGVVSGVLKCGTGGNSQKTRNTETSNHALHGAVEVSFKIGLDGKANILNIKSANPNLVEYVKNKLKKIQLQKDDINIDDVITYRFIFKKDA
ncbi:MAG: hypothetical protein QNL21_08415 [Flavobacteriales bacterium]|jgi:hypothetical protein